MISLLEPMSYSNSLLYHITVIIWDIKTESLAGFLFWREGILSQLEEEEEEEEEDDDDDDDDDMAVSDQCGRTTSHWREILLITDTRPHERKVMFERRLCDR